MEPTIENGQTVLATRIIGTVRPGDIVVFVHEIANGRHSLVKRVIAIG